MALTVEQCIKQAEHYLLWADGTSDIKCKTAYVAMATAYQRHAKLLIRIARLG